MKKTGVVVNITSKLIINMICSLPVLFGCAKNEPHVCFVSKILGAGNPIQNKDHNCHDADSCTLSPPPHISITLSLSPFQPPPPLPLPAAVLVERLMQGYNVLLCALWRPVLLVTRNLHHTIMCLSSPVMSNFYYICCSQILHTFSVMF